MTQRALCVRIFLTCWLVYMLHFATNTVREVYLALAIGDHLSYRVDDYGGMHDDLFELPGRGWHIGNNPGASMLAAVPYSLAAPVINRVVERVNQQRAASGAKPPEYQSVWPRARAFFAEAWRRGYDIKFGLGAWVMQAFCMAPFSAAAVVVMFLVLLRLTESQSAAMWLALLYAFGTPVFFRTGYINQNMLLGHFALAGLALLMFGESRRAVTWAGVMAGMGLLCDYSGAATGAVLALYCVLKQRRHLLWFILGAVPPVLLLWQYQYASFGNPFLPGQHYMPPVEFIERGYQGVSGPQAELAYMLALDHRFGLFTSCPLLLLALAAPFVKRLPLARRELWMALLGASCVWALFMTVNYTRLQFNAGIRYMAPAIPFLFIPAALVLRRMFETRLGAWAGYAIVVAALTESWCLAMYRDVERGMGLAEPVFRVMTSGFMLPALNTLGRIQGGELGAIMPSPLPLFALTAVLLYGIWRRWEA